MMGLALGVDYALLMVSRFREELAAGPTPPRRRGERGAPPAGRRCSPAAPCSLSMLVSLLILPGVAARLPGRDRGDGRDPQRHRRDGRRPGALTLIGPNVDRWRIGPAPGGRSRLMAFVDAALKRPAPVAALIGVVLLVLAAPALGLKTGPPSPEQLGKDSAPRENAEKIDTAIGPGWDAPFQVIAVSDKGPITDASSLAAVQRFQTRVAELPGVQAVIGPGQISKRVEPLQELGNAVLSSEGNIGAVKQLGRLGRNLGQAAGGVAELRDGISEASAGAGLLATGSDRAGEGAQQIAAGLGRATAGSARAITALESFAKGSAPARSGDRGSRDGGTGTGSRDRIRNRLQPQIQRAEASPQASARNRSRSERDGAEAARPRQGRRSAAEDGAGRSCRG